MLAQIENTSTRAFSQKITNKFHDVIADQRLVGTLTEADLADLPVGIARVIGNTTYVIAIDSAYRNARGDGWFFSAYTAVVFPGTTDTLAFSARNIGFKNGGISGSNHVKLTLVSDEMMEITEQFKLHLPADGHNYIEFDCNGFKDVNLKGEFIFGDSLLEPDPALAPTAKDVRAIFETNAADFNDIITSTSITPFRIKNLNEITFYIQNATIDFSDLRNPSGFSFPQEYLSEYGEAVTLWRGFYLHDAFIKMKLWKDNTVIAAHDMLIDDRGVSGFFLAENPFPKTSSHPGKWPMTIDALSVTLLMNKVTGGSLAGTLSIPFLGDDRIPYLAAVTQGNHGLDYQLAAGISEGKTFNTGFSTSITIGKGSMVAFEKVDTAYHISATLNGTLSTKDVIKVEKLKFERLILTTRAPYILGGTFSSVGETKSKAGGFPLSISKIQMKIYPGQFGLSFDVAFNLSGSSSNSGSTSTTEASSSDSETGSSNNSKEKPFSASTNIEMLVKMVEKQTPPSEGEPTKTEHKWELDRVKVNQIKLACHTQALILDGTLDFYKDDVVYGDGFHGFISFSLPKVMKNGIQVNAYFGSKDDFRYWHFDGRVGTNIAIYPGLFITSFMGGASHRMVRQQPLIPDFSKMPTPDETKTPDPAEGALVYTPDARAGLSFLAGITLVIGNDAAVNGDIMFEVAFNNGGGIKYVQFNGGVFFMAPSKSRDKTKDGKAPAETIFASMSMLYDTDNEVFHSNMKTYVNMGSLVRGIGPNGLVGEAVIHIDKHDWYTYIGRPSAMFGVSVLGLLTAETYFMVGTKIENLPLPPKEVRDIIGEIDYGLMRDDVASAGGKGFAAGLRLSIGYDSKDQLNPFYMMFAIGGGSDVMMRNYGSAECVGRNGAIGIHGWYASGQAYVYLAGKVGLHVKHHSFDILSIGLAALLQATLPNPAWLRGMLSGSYSVLGGLVKGKFNLKFEVGEQCQIKNNGNEAADITVIGDMKPSSSNESVSVFSAPQVSFNTAINTEFSMVDLNNQSNAYRVVQDEFTLTNNNRPIETKIQWNANNDVAVLKTHEILPQNANLVARVKIHWEKRSGNNPWEVMKVGNQTYYEEKSVSFVTGEAPAFIDENNITFSYPLNGQHNLHPKESDQGYVQLNQGQAYLFQPTSDSTTWQYTARFTDVNGKAISTPLTYNEAASRVNFSIPTTLSGNAIYALTFVKTPARMGNIDTNVQRHDVNTNQDGDNEMTIASSSLNGTLKQDLDKIIYRQHFCTSRYSTFQEKWRSAFESGRDVFDIAKGNVAVIAKHGNMKELFDQFETDGFKGTAPMLQLSAAPDVPWLKEYISPLLYDHYPPANDILINWRNPEELGVKPLKGVTLHSQQSDYLLTDSEIETGVSMFHQGDITIGYFLSYYAFQDYNELINEATNKYFDNWTSMPPAVKQLLKNNYVDLISGEYPVNISYTLPGETKPTFQTQLVIKL